VTEKHLAGKQKEKAKVLVITHGGFIMEFLNVVRSLKGLMPIFNNVAKNTSLTIIEFNMEKSKAKGMKLMPKVLMENDNSHLGKVLEVKDVVTVGEENKDEEEKEAPDLGGA